jgi:FG-GAP-like repeat/ASPIC and UnbV/PPIC-type PPIASE domain
MSKRARLAIIFLALTLPAQQPVKHESPLGIIVTASEPEALQILERLKKGEDFAALARAKSIDPSANDGGYLGILDPLQLRMELKNALNGVGYGQVSGIVRIPAGYAIVKVLTQVPGNATPSGSPVARQSISSAGAVRLTYDYAGFASALRAVDKFEKPEGWNSDLHAACEVRTAAIPAVIDQLKPLLTRPGAPPAFLRDANTLLGDLHSYGGDFDRALGYWQASYKVALASSPERAPQMEEAIGVAYLQRAGLALYGDFVFPRSLKTELTPQQKDDLHNAADYFARYLKRVPADGEVRWLLNLTFMLSGQYPAAVPKDYLIAPSVFESKEDVVHFTNVAAISGLNRNGQAGGVIVDDFDNDGLLDVVMSNVNDCEPLAFYHNNGDGTFTNRAAQAGLLDQTGGLNIMQTDYNNDGCKDILVLRGGWEYPRRKSLLRNNCNGTFTDVTRQSGLGAAITSTQTAAWADIDNDGLLDLFIGNENAPAQLFLNKGDGTFVEIGATAGVNRVGFTKGVVAADYDNDGYTDLYVSALNGDHHLYRNNHDRTFTDVTEKAGVEGPWTTFGALFFDYDNDGFQDLLVAGYGASVEDVMKGYLKQPQGGEGLRLFRNLGNGKFRDVSAETGLNRVFMPMGLNFGDVDNDGFPDFYLGSGNPSYASPIPNVLFHNNGGRAFTDITASSGTGVLPKGHGIAFADLDNDGDEDIFVVMGGAVPGDRQAARLFENPGNGNSWLTVRLVGEKSNRAAVGARVKVTVQDGAAGTRSIYRTVSSGGSFGASPFEQHIGLGKTAGMVTVEVWWPASNIRQTFPAVRPNQTIEIKELGKEFRAITRPAFKLGSGTPSKK